MPRIGPTELLILIILVGSIITAIVVTSKRRKTNVAITESSVKLRTASASVVGMAVVGATALIGGFIAYSQGSSHTADCQSFVGQLGRALSGTLQQECQNWEYVKTGGMIGIIVGVVLLGVAVLRGFIGGLAGKRGEKTL